MFLLSKEVLLGNFENRIESIQCPYCFNGKLVHKKEPSTSIGINHVFSDKYWWQYLENDEYGASNRQIFCDCFQCDNPNCKEGAVIIGVKYTQLIGCEDEYSYELRETVTSYEYRDKFTIKHIEPSLDLFSIPKGLISSSLELTYELKKAFYLFWVDKDACANKIRIFVEMLLDELKIQPAHNLHHRIEKHMQKSRNTKLVSLGNKLMAIKWIGNQGSHSDRGLTSENLVVALEILENVLNKIYDKTDILIAQKVKQINKNKKV